MAKSKLHIEIANHTEGWTVPTKRIRQVVAWIAEDYEYEAGEISIVVVDDDEIRSLNRTHLNHDWATDAISFVFENEERLEGEVIVSIETAHRLSQSTSWGGSEELLLYVIHGMLHLVGMDDLDEESALEMRREEQHYLEKLGVPGAAQHVESFEKTRDSQ